MKLNKILTISLLSGSMLLCSCDFLFPRKKADNQNYGSNVNKDDYQGKTGVTKLNEEDWNRAFSYEEMIYHRSFTVDYAISINESSAAAKAEIDHGNVRITSEGEEIYLSYSPIRDDGKVTVTLIQNINGQIDSEAYTGNFIDVSSIIGFAQFPYNAFTYDSVNATYTADSFTFPEIDGGDDFYGADATIEIKDGLPNFVTFNYKEEERTYLYSATYSEYGKTVVSLPGINKDNDDFYRHLTKPTGNLITFDDFLMACERVENNRPEYTFVRTLGDRYKNGKNDIIIHIEGYFIADKWQVHDGYADKVADETEATNMIFTSELINSFEINSPYYSYEFYYNSKENCYYVFYVTYGESTRETLIQLNEDFYVIYREDACGVYNQYFNVDWFYREELADQGVLWVNDRVFKCTTLYDQHEEEYVYGYSDITMTFDNNCNCCLLFKDGMNYYGEYYDNLDGMGGGQFAIRGKEQYEYIDRHFVSTDFNLEIMDSELIVSYDRYLMVFEYDESFNGHYIEFPLIPGGPENSIYEGYYSFARFICDGDDWESYSDGENYIDKKCSLNDYKDYYIDIAQNSAVTMYVNGVHSTGYCYYDYETHYVKIIIEYYVDPVSGEKTPAEEGAYLLLTLDLGDTKGYEIYHEDHFTVYAAFDRQY